MGLMAKFLQQEETADRIVFPVTQVAAGDATPVKLTAGPDVVQQLVLLTFSSPNAVPASDPVTSSPASEPVFRGTL